MFEDILGDYKDENTGFVEAEENQVIGPDFLETLSECDCVGCDDEDEECVCGGSCSHCKF
jgi:hypothetical protein